MKDEVANNDGNIQHSYDYFVVASSKITIKRTEKPDYKSDLNITAKCHTSGNENVDMDTLQNQIYNFVDEKGILGKDNLFLV